MDHLGSGVGKPVRAGYLWKRGDFNKTFKRRYFILRKDSLFYFKKKGAGKPAGIIELRQAKVVDLKGANKKDNAFQVVTNKRVYVLQCAFEFERDGWIREIGNRIGFSKSQYKLRGGYSAEGSKGRGDSAGAGACGEAIPEVEDEMGDGGCDEEDEETRLNREARHIGPAMSCIGPLVAPERAASGLPVGGLPTVDVPATMAPAAPAAGRGGSSCEVKVATIASREDGDGGDGAEVLRPLSAGGTSIQPPPPFQGICMPPPPACPENTDDLPPPEALPPPPPPCTGMPGAPPAGDEDDAATPGGAPDQASDGSFSLPDDIDFMELPPPPGAPPPPLDVPIPGPPPTAEPGGRPVSTQVRGGEKKKDKRDKKVFGVTGLEEVKAPSSVGPSATAAGLQGTAEGESKQGERDFIVIQRKPLPRAMPDVLPLALPPPSCSASGAAETTALNVASATPTILSSDGASPSSPLALVRAKSAEVRAQREGREGSADGVCASPAGGFIRKEWARVLAKGLGEARATAPGVGGETSLGDRNAQLRLRAQAKFSRTALRRKPGAATAAAAAPSSAIPCPGDSRSAQDVTAPPGVAALASASSAGSVDGTESAAQVLSVAVEEIRGASVSTASIDSTLSGHSGAGGSFLMTTHRLAVRKKVARFTQAQMLGASTHALSQPLPPSGRSPDTDA